jgi:hypothetical protein
MERIFLICIGAVIFSNPSKKAAYETKDRSAAPPSFFPSYSLNLSERLSAKALQTIR